MDGPSTSNTDGTMTTSTKKMNNDFDQNDRTPSMLSEDESRKMILDSYEKAGVDLPLVSLETVLDRHISADDARQTGAPRFRKFLNKASSAMSMSSSSSNMNSNNNNNNNIQQRNNKDNKKDSGAVPDDEEESVPDDEFIDTPASASSDSSSNNSEQSLENQNQNKMPQVERRENQSHPQSQSQHPRVPINSRTNNTATTAPAMIQTTITHPTFDFCCPESSTTTTTNPNGSFSDKYVMSNLQLAEGFDNEYNNHNVHGARIIPALMDVENSMMDTTFTTMDKSRAGKQGYLSKGGNNNGLMSYFRGSRRFRWAIFVCCLLHIILVSLIIIFVMNMDNQGYEAGASSSSSSITQDQTTTTTSSSSSTTNTTADLVTSKTLFPDPDLDQPNSTSSSTSPLNNAKEDTITQDNSAEIAIVDNPSSSSSPDNSCADTLELSLNCFGVGSELLVYFESCTPQPGDWVAIYESSEDPENLLDSDSIGWLFTCGNRRCNEAIQKEVLSFPRATGRAGVGTYRAYLIRSDGGPFYSSFASSPEFRVVANAYSSCESK